MQLIDLALEDRGSNLQTIRKVDGEEKRGNQSSNGLPMGVETSPLQDKGAMVLTIPSCYCMHCNGGSEAIIKVVSG